MTTNPDIEVKNLDHLGLIALYSNTIELVEIINNLGGEQPGEIVSPGQVVKAIILNGLGLVSAPLYLFSRFFEKKPTSSSTRKKCFDNWCNKSQMRCD